MSTPQPPILSTVLVFAGFYLGFVIAMELIAWALETYANGSMDSYLFGVLPSTLAAWQTGDRFGRLVGAKPDIGYAWLTSLLFLVVSGILSLVLFYGLLLYQGYSLTAAVNLVMFELQRADVRIIDLAPVMVALLLLLWLCDFFAFKWGASLGAKSSAMRNR
jgi:CDP-diglyceride synthetase